MKWIPVILFFSLSSLLFSQESNSIQEIRNKYESFEYRSVIQLTDDLLSRGDSLSQDILTEILTMKAVAHFSLGERISSRNSFVELLNLDKDYEPDPVTVSPKIITFFNEIKETYKPVQEDIPVEKITVIDTVKVSDPLVVAVEKAVIQGSALRSVILPGWGHLYLEDYTKGWILTSASTITLGSMIFFIVDANNKEQDYLNESRPDQIIEKYDAYNKSYQIRNGLIITYLAIWLYAQADIFFFSNDLISQKINTTLTLQHGELQLNLSLKLPF
jgi:hypothetical protein